MKRVLIICVVVIYFPVSAQITNQSLKEVDSLISENLFEQASNRLSILLKVAADQSNPLLYRAQILQGDLNLSKGSYRESIDAYLEVADLPTPSDSIGALALAKSINDLGIAYYKIGSLDSAKWAHHKSLDIYKRYNYPLGLSYNYNNLSIIAKQEKKFEESLQMLEQALKASIKGLDSLGIGFIYMNMGTTYADNTSRLKGLDYLYRSIEVFNNIGNQRMATRAKINLAGIYNRLGSYDSALTLLSKASSFYESQANTRNQAYLSVRLSEIFASMDQLDSAEYHADLALRLSTESQRTINTGRAYHLKGLIAKKKKNYAQALALFQEGLSQLKGKFKGQAFVIRVAQAETLLKQENYQQALVTAKNALTDVGDNPNLGSEVSAYNVIYRAYKALNDDSNTIKWLEKFIVAQDSLFNKEKALEVARIEYRDYLVLKEQQEKIEREQLQLGYQRDLERQAWVQYSILGAAGLLLVILVLIYRSFIRKKRDNRLLSYKNETIEAKHEELLAKNEELQTLREKDQDNQQRERRLLQETIYLKERELAGTAMINHEKNSILNSISEQLMTIANKVEGDVKRNVVNLKKMVNANINSDDSWDSFIHQFEHVHPQFFKNLKDAYPNLTVNDLKLCAYIKVGMNNKEIAGATNTALSTVKKNINRLKKKIDLEADESVRDFLILHI